MSVNFEVRVNDGCVQHITVESGIYRDAAAATLALLEVSIPSIIEIWSPAALPQYGPYFFPIAAGASRDKKTESS